MKIYQLMIRGVEEISWDRDLMCKLRASTLPTLGYELKMM